MQHLTSNLVSVFGAFVILVFFERFFTFPGSRLDLHSWLLISSLLFLLASSIALVTFLATLVLRPLEKFPLLRLIKHLLFAIAFSIPAYELSTHLAKGNWVKNQWWVDYFSLGFVLLIFLGSVIASLLFFKIRGLKSSPLFAFLAILLSLGLLFAHSKIIGGAYTYVYFSLYFCGVFVLVEAFNLFKIHLKFGRIFLILLFLFILGGSLHFAKNSSNFIRAKADDNSLIFSNLSGILLPSHKLTFIEKVLIVEEKKRPAAEPQLGPPPGDADWNVLFIVVDTLRADVFSPWRSQEKDALKVTPFLDTFLSDAITFERSYAQASGTLLSMPSMFRSLEANTALTKYGRPIGQRFSEEGFRTFAVVNNFFIEPRYKRTRGLLDGFEDVQVYQKRSQNDLQGMSQHAFEKYKDEKWFAWIHFYNMHHTAFDGTFLKGMPKKPAYKRAAKWLDDQMKALVADLKRKKLLSHTIIVFTADHGESFGKKGRRGHGGTVLEDEIRVPLAIKIPGLKGRHIKGSVGNVDLLPTLLDLVRLPRDPTLAGRSLVPYLEKDKVPDSSYYLTNIPKDEVAILRGSHKLVLKTKKGILQLFDLAKDPLEKNDIFDTKGKRESRLRRDLVFKHPKIVKKEIKSPASLSFLSEQIDALSIKDEKASLLLSKIVAQNPTKKLMDQLSKKILSKDNPHLVKHYRALCRSPFSSTIKEEMKKRIGDPKTRGKSLREIVDLWCPAFDLNWIKTMMKQATPDEREFWLSLSLRYKNRQRKSLIPLFSSWLKEDLKLKTRRLIYRNIAATRFLYPSSTPVEDVRAGLQMDPFTAESAIRALGSLKDKSSSPRLMKMIQETKSLRIKQAALHALAQIGEKNALGAIRVAIKKDPILTLDGAKAIYILGDQKGLETLDELGRNYHNDIIRSAIRKLAKKMRSKGKMTQKKE